jgi:hypothetical protein
MKVRGVTTDVVVPSNPRVVQEQHQCRSRAVPTSRLFGYAKGFSLSHASRRKDVRGKA